METYAQAYAPFVPWGPSHMALLGGSILLPVLLALACHGRARWVRVTEWALALIVFASWLGWYVIGAPKGWLDGGNILPLNLCDWAAAAVIIALITHNQRAYELAYFWALGGTMQALISPDVRYDFPEIRMIQFTGFHSGILAGALFLCLGPRMRPYLSSLPRTFAATAAYGLLAGAVDALTGSNYGFLRAKPDIASALSAMPGWPYYLPWLVLCAVVAICICYAPFWVLDLLRRKRCMPDAAP